MFPRPLLRGLLIRPRLSHHPIRLLSTNPQPQPQPQPSLQKPLLDKFSRQHTYLRLSLTERCNLRCFYCMPDTTQTTTTPPTHLTLSEIARLAQIFVSRGIKKIRLTGGEPTLRSDLPQIIHRLSVHPVQIGITTNGILLPRLLPALLDAGLSTVNISLDSLDPALFELLTKRKGHHRVLEAVTAALKSGLTTKLNVVVMKGVNDHELPRFIEFTRNHPLDVRFIEYMPFDGNRWSHNKFLSYADMLHSIATHYGTLQNLPTSLSDTTKYYRVPGYVGRLGFITSMTNHFCAGCNRIRVTADGNLKVCLFGNHEVSLRDLMRAGATDHDLENVIQHALMNKHFALGGNKDMFDISTSQNRSMVRIGG